MRRVRVLLLTALALVMGSVMSSAPASAVIGGSKSTYGPWAVRMLVDGKPACTGTAVARQWILTASHCFYEQALPVADKRISFRVGNLDMRRGTKVRPIPGKRVGSAHADMMLVKVPPMNVPTARLATVGVHPGQAVRQYGWGATCTRDESACQSPVLKQSDLKVVRPNDPLCAGRHRTGRSRLLHEEGEGDSRRGRLGWSGDDRRPARHRNPHRRFQRLRPGEERRSRRGLPAAALDSLRHSAVAAEAADLSRLSGSDPATTPPSSSP